MCERSLEWAEEREKGCEEGEAGREEFVKDRERKEEDGEDDRATNESGGRHWNDPRGGGYVGVVSAMGGGGCSPAACAGGYGRGGLGGLGDWVGCVSVEEFGYRNLRRFLS